MDDPTRLRHIVRLTSRQRGFRRASSGAPLGIAFRLLARLGLFGWFVDHQRLVHTFASNLRGPATPLSIGRHQIAHLSALSVTPGNIGVSFTALSYAGGLGLTVVADPMLCDPQPVADFADEVLDQLMLLFPDRPAPTAESTWRTGSRLRRPVLQGCFARRRRSVSAPIDVRWVGRRPRSN